MSKDKARLEIMDLIRFKHPGGEIAYWEWHSAEVVTTLIVVPSHRTYLSRWNRGESGRWTMIPVLNESASATF